MRNQVGDDGADVSDRQVGKRCDYLGQAIEIGIPLSNVVRSREHERNDNYLPR